LLTSEEKEKIEEEGKNFHKNIDLTVNEGEDSKSDQTILLGVGIHQESGRGILLGIRSGHKTSLNSKKSIETYGFNGNQF
jgi:hypothetical protein